MDNPDHILSLLADPTGLTAARAKKLRTAVSTVEHRLALWHPFITAATTHPLHITVTTADDSGFATASTISAHLDTEHGNLRLQVPHSLLQEPPNRIAAQILDITVPELVAHAERHPHPQQPVLWVHSKDWRPPTDEPEAGIDLGDILEGDVLLIARHGGTATDAEFRERTLNDHLCERLENPGIAASDGAFATETAVAWTLELL